jgi:hypothetical protein
MVFEPVINDETQILRCKTLGGRCVIDSLSKCVNLTLLRFKSRVCVAVPVAQYLYPTRLECVLMCRRICKVNGRIIVVMAEIHMDVQQDSIFYCILFAHTQGSI